jgi:hypothetical protein
MSREAPHEDRARSLRSVALPVEHGGWGFLLEPIILGLLVAPSVAGAALGSSALFAFLARHPLKLAMADRQRGVRQPRTVLAERVAAAYGLAAALALAAAWPLATRAFWPFLAAAAPVGLVQLLYDVRLKGRQLVPELAGALALGAVAPAMARAAGWEAAPAACLFGILALRAVSAILYVRARLRLDRGMPAGVRPSVAGHLAALVLACALALSGQAPWLAAVAFAILLLRAVHGLSTARGSVRPQALGFRELGFGALTTALLALGYTLDL